MVLLYTLESTKDYTQSDVKKDNNVLTEFARKQKQKSGFTYKSFNILKILISYWKLLVTT